MRVTENTLSEIKECYEVYWYDDYLNEVSPEKATKLHVSWETSGRIEDWVPVGISFPLPKKKEITFGWVNERVTSKQGSVRAMVDFSKKFKDFLHKNGFTTFNVYPTSYGIGVSTLFRGSNSQGDIQDVKNALDNIGVHYTNEYSDALWVYRFCISKSKENINTIEKFCNEEHH
jgi:hypothetical protein